MEAEPFSLDLQEDLMQARGDPAVKWGYLFKHKPYAEYLEDPWELKFFRNENEVLSNSKGDAYDIDRWWITVDKNDKGVTFNIENKLGDVVLILREAESGEESPSWVDSFKSVGCRVLMDGQEQFVSSSDSVVGKVTSLINQEESQEPEERTKLQSDVRRILSSSASNKTDFQKEETNSSSDEKQQKDTAQVDANIMYVFRPSTPAHKKNKESPLSSDQIFHQSHAGLFNLCIVCLIAVNGRLIIENLMKYGLLIQTGFWFSSKSLKDWPLLMCGLSLPILPLSSLMVEKMVLTIYVPNTVKFLLHAVIVNVSILYPSYIIHRFNSSFQSGIILIMASITTWMKLISYAHANHDARALWRKGETVEKASDASNLEYPDNITVSDIAYFMVAPTLCYQIGYPRRKTMRKGWVLRQTLKLIVFTGLMGFIVEQYINPTVKNSEHPLKGSYLKALERVLKLSIPTLYLWLCMFYSVFHLWLNILAELTRFGDREFYKDWWNAKTIDEYWRKWNMPVHRWMIRHVYFPCLRAGIPKPCALFLVFILSAVFHEVCVAIPSHMVRCWAFLGMLFQVPLVFLTIYLQKKYNNMMLGNMLFWFFFCIVGQPMCVLLYYHDIVNKQLPTTAPHVTHTEL